MASVQEEVAMVAFEEEKEREEEVIKWDLYLPRMPVRVLLVEGDDSTRQIITALLRKCSYRVFAASDGTKAWEILKEKSYNIDLVLTEIDLPLMSGFGLLSMIMEHDSCKNIPVIMMSSHDSMSMVFKCMLKGAADFLVKPIRKNELRNLWQHVWRRHIQLNGGSGSIQANQDSKLPSLEKDSKSITEKPSDKNANMQKNKELSEQRSDAQSSCTRSEMEAESKHNIENKIPSCLDLIDPIIEETEQNTNNSEEIEVVVGTKEDANSREDNFSGTFPHLELSLRRIEYENQEKSNSNNNKLNHSNSSPFSLYNKFKPTPATTETESSPSAVQNRPIRSVAAHVPAGGLPFEHLFASRPVDPVQGTESSHAKEMEGEQGENLEMSKRIGVSCESWSSCVSVSNGGGNLGNLQNTDTFNRVLSPRELALNKFRLKRKERCFEKKVRYQSRKLLAEKRPRIKGQFVRQEQTVQEGGTKET